MFLVLLLLLLLLLLLCRVHQELLESEFEAVLSMSQTQVSKVLMELSDADARSNSPSLQSCHPVTGLGLTYTRHCQQLQLSESETQL